MTFSEYLQLEKRAEAAGIGGDSALVQLLHYVQFREAATRRFQAHMREYDAWGKALAKDVESRIREAEAVGNAD